MRITTKDRRFPAVLKNAGGKVLSEGFATVSRQNRSVEFESDFVPLYPLGTNLKIERIHDNKPIHLFWGDVYLSDKKLLRLISVDDLLLPGSEQVYTTNVTVPAVLTESFAGKKHGFLHKLFKNKESLEPKSFSIQINAVSGQGFEFNSNEAFEIGEEFLLTMQLKPQPLEDIPVVIDRAYAFNEGTGYRCAFCEMDPMLKECLNAFIGSLNQLANKIFQDET